MTEQPLTELKQRYLNERREFVLEPDRIRIFTKDASGEIESSISYEDLTTRTRQVTQQDGALYMATISFGVFALVGLIASAAGVPTLMRWVPLWIIATPVLFAFHLAKRRRYLLVDLSDDRSLFFLRDRPSKERLADFLTAMQAARVKYLRDTYLKPNPHNDAQRELMKYRWLLSQGAITDAEFQGLTSEPHSGTDKPRFH